MKTYRKKGIFITILIILFGGLFLWWLTGKWMADGLENKARGANEFVIVLGAKVNGETPSLSLQYRLETAYDYAVHYPGVTLVLSGGQGDDELISEAEAMRRYLTEKGISEDRLIIEDKSTSTYENLAFSKEMLPPHTDQITIITSDYHVARALKLADTLGFKADAAAAKTPEIVEQKLKMRERFALLKTYLWGK